MATPTGDDPWRLVSGGARQPELRRLYFSIDRSERSYWFGINHTNRHIWPEKFWEHDAIEVHGSIRHAYNKPIEKIRLHVEPIRVPRERFNTEATDIGGAWMEQKMVLYAHVGVPADAFYSLAESLGRGEFKEVSLTLLDLKRGRARVDGFCLEPRLTADDNLCVI